MDDSKSRNAVKIRGDSSSRDNSIIMDVISSRTARIDSREASRDTSNSRRDKRNITNVNSRRETSKSKDARNGREKPTTVIASAGTPTAQYGCQQLKCSAKICQKFFRTTKNS
jgi:hypothetical protein